MKKLLLLTLFLFSLLPSAKASHLVGGEIELEHVADTSYIIRVFTYFDLINGDPTAKETKIFITIRSKATDSLISHFPIFLREQDTVEYSNPECDDGSLKTIRYTFREPITLSPAIFNEPAGYYVTWERCCRNGDIVNIEAPDSTAQVFYMEMPPIIKNGQPFYNSSPAIFPPLRDYACDSLPFFADFRGIDPDGDSLVYSLAEPWMGINARVDNNFPDTAFARPYKPVDWKPGFSVNNMIKGERPLSISQDGLITVIPGITGLHVFAIKIEEFRDGVKIGEVRRDFQMLVIDCIPFEFPEITNVGFSPDSSYVESDTITYTYGQDAPCLSFFVKDKDPNTVLTTEVRPLNFSLGGAVSLSPSGGTLNSPTDSIEFKLCLPDCPLGLQETYAFEVLVKDNSCALPLMDTARFFVRVIPEPNTVPQFDLPIPFVADSNYYFVELELGSELDFDLKVVDAEGDSIALRFLDINNQLAQLQQVGSFSFPNQTGSDSLESRLLWNPTNCTSLPKDRTEWFFPLQFATRDFERCDNFSLSDTITVMVRLFYNPPAIEKLLTVSPIEFDATTNQFFVDLKTGEQLDLAIVGFGRNTSLALSAFPDGFTFNQFGMNFTPVSGSDSIQTAFSWSPTCEDLEGDMAKNFKVSFVSSYEDICFQETKSDTLELEIRLQFEATPNQVPTVSTELSSADTTVCDTVYLGETVDFEVIGADADNHFLSLSAIPKNFNFSDYGISFPKLEAFGSVSQNLKFESSCDASQYPNPTNSQEELLIDFIVQDSSNCYIKSADTISVKILFIKELSPNTAPTISTDLPNFDASTMTYTISALVGEQIDFIVLAEDSDLANLLNLEAIGEGFNLSDLGMDFTNQSGISPLSTNFTWQTDCQYLGQLGADTTYTISFSIKDETKDCNAFGQNEIKVEIQLSDVTQTDFLPANAFSPNGDGVGDEFHLSNLPENDCNDQFKSISIYNRWGKSVFQSNKRDFRWDGSGLPSGIYFYEIQFVNSSFKGNVHLLRGK
jgi:gliding motility-associated-like protein